MIFAVSAAALALGLALLILGLRGRRIDDHPICRRCRFDLIGVGRETGGTCPECGSDLAREKATRRGTRRRSRPALALAVLLLVAGIGVGAAAGWSATRGYDWNKVKPDWMLLREARGLRPEPGVRSELFKRLRGDRLSHPESLKLMELALAVQADATIPWDLEWGRMIELGRERGLVSDEQWGAFARNADGTLVVATFQNALVWRADRLHLTPMMQVGQGRGGLSTTLVKRHRLERVTVNGEPVEIPDDYAGRFGVGSQQLGVSGGFSHGYLAIPLRSGRIKVELEWTVLIQDDSAPEGRRTLVERVERFTNEWDADSAQVVLPAQSSPPGAAGWAPIVNRPTPASPPR